MEISFWQIVIVAFLAIFPPVNPLGTALTVDPFLNRLTHSQRKKASAKIAFYCFCVCFVSATFGGTIFKLFGISLPAVQIAGGLLISKLGFEILTSNSTPEEKEVGSADGWKKLEPMLFYPLSFPVTTGAGTISVLLTLSADNYDPISTQHLSNILALCVGVFLMCLCIFVSYAYAPFLLRKMGAKGQNVMNRLSGFITFCVGIQVFINGVTGFIKSVL